jgi:hypothetical protein
LHWFRPPTCAKARRNWHLGRRWIFCGPWEGSTVRTDPRGQLFLRINRSRYRSAMIGKFFLFLRQRCECSLPTRSASNRRFSLPLIIAPPFKKYIFIENTHINRPPPLTSITHTSPPINGCMCLLNILLLLIKNNILCIPYRTIIKLIYREDRQERETSSPLAQFLSYIENSIINATLWEKCLK